MEVVLRLGEDRMTPEQIAQREASYDAAKILRAAGIVCRVVEYYCADSPRSTAASIVIGERLP